MFSEHQVTDHIAKVWIALEKLKRVLDTGVRG